MKNSLDNSGSQHHSSYVFLFYGIWVKRGHLKVFLTNAEGLKKNLLHVCFTDNKTALNSKHT